MVLLSGVLSLGVASAIGMVATDAIYYGKEKVTEVGVGLRISGHIFQTLPFFILIWYMWRYYPQWKDYSQHCKDCKRSCSLCLCSKRCCSKVVHNSTLCLLLALMGALPAAVVAMEIVGDIIYFDKDLTSALKIWVGIRGISKLMILVSTWISVVIVVVMITKAIGKWDESKVPSSGDWKNEEETTTVIQEIVEGGVIQEIVDRKVYYLYNFYTKTGKEIRPQREILKPWFVVHYSVYLIYVLSEVVHVLNNKSERDAITVLQASFLLVYDLLGLLVPYLVANWLNQAHHKYHRKILKACFKLLIKDTKGNVLVMKPGFDSEKSDEDDNKFDIESTCEFKSTNYRTLHANLKNKYRDYYNFVLAKNIALKSEFDFVPSILSISIPLDSPGYALALLLSIMSLVITILP